MSQTDLQSDLKDEINAPVEPLLPIEKKLIGWSFGLGIALLASRFASAFALNRSLGQSPLRQFGGGTSVLVLAAASVVLLLALNGLR